LTFEALNLDEGEWIFQVKPTSKKLSRLALGQMAPLKYKMAPLKLHINTSSYNSELQGISHTCEGTSVYFRLAEFQAYCSALTHVDLGVFGMFSLCFWVEYLCFSRPHLRAHRSRKSG